MSEFNQMKIKNYLKTMCAEVKDHLPVKQNKRKKFLNNVFSRILSTSSATKSSIDHLQTDAVLIDPKTNDVTVTTPSVQSVARIRSSATDLDLTNHQQNGTMHLIQNNLNQTSPSMTVIKSQNNYNFNHINGLQFGNTIQCVMPNPRKNSHNGSYESDASIENQTNNDTNITKTKYQRTQAVKDLMECNDPVDEKIMDIASSHMTDWRFVLRRLGVPNGTIKHTHEESFHIGIKEIIYTLLLDWSRNFDDKSIGRLVRVLWRSDNRECVMKLVEYFDKKKSQNLSESPQQEHIDKDKVDCDSDLNISD